MKIQYKWFFVLSFILLLSACQQNTNTPTGSTEKPLLGSEDFNRDAKDDLAIGAPLEDINGKVNTGAVNIIYGSYTDLTSAGDQFWHQDVSDIEDNAEAGDLFGDVLAIGDFDGNGKNDLAIGVPRETVNGKTEAGAVHIIYGHRDASGLNSFNNLFLSPDALNEYDNFGSALAVGDFDNDGKDDLAVGTPFHDSGGPINEGINNGGVYIFYGSSNGLPADSRIFVFRDKEDIIGSSNQSGANFGTSLVAADFNGDGLDDLAVGSPLEDISGVNNAGVVDIISGGDLRNSLFDSTRLVQNIMQIEETSEAGDQFGNALTACDYNNDGKADLAISATHEDIGGIDNAGIVHILYGSNDGITSAGNQIWHQDTAGIQDVAEQNDRFGHALTSGYFNSDGACDLAVGVPFEKVAGQRNAGLVNVLYGSSTGIVATGNQMWHQNSRKINDVVEANDWFGYSLAAGDFNGDRKDDLAIGVPSEDLGSVQNAGGVSVIYGSDAGLTRRKDDFWTQNSSGINDVSEAGDQFGRALAARR